MRVLFVPLLLQTCSLQASGFVNTHLSLTSRILRPQLGDAIRINRGGANVPLHATNMDDSSDYSSDDSDEGDSESSEVDLVTSRFEDVAAQNAKQMASSPMDEGSRTEQSRSYLISSALWGSLALDTVLNKKKRSIIFPGVAEVGGKVLPSNIGATASLSSGFLLSAGLAYLLSRELNPRGPVQAQDWNEEIENHAIRKKLHLLLFLYGIGNLCANINPGSAPFFGVGGFVINAHNSLIALNGWIKESSSSATKGNDHSANLQDFFNTFKSMFGSLVKNPDVSMGFATKLFSSLYLCCAMVAGLRCLDIAKNILVPHYTLCYASKSLAVAPLLKLQAIGLKWAALSRTILAGGTVLIMKNEVDSGRLKGRVSKSLAALIAICSFAAGVPAMFSQDILHFSSGFKMILLGSIVSVSSFFL